jgi:hypothetical protein
MESNYPKYFYLLFFLIGSWLLTCLLHFRQPLFHLLGSGTAVFLPFLCKASFFFFLKKQEGEIP